MDFTYHKNKIPDRPESIFDVKWLLRIHELFTANVHLKAMFLFLF